METVVGLRTRENEGAKRRITMAEELAVCLPLCHGDRCSHIISPAVGVKRSHGISSFPSSSCTLLAVDSIGFISFVGTFTCRCCVFLFVLLVCIFLLSASRKIEKTRVARSTFYCGSQLLLFVLVLSIYFQNHLFLL